jgi:D-3-phosphoglycerate dehydrogenase
MKSIFIDCNDQLDAVFARVYRPDDPPIVVNTRPVEASALPRLIDGYDVCLDDHSYMPTELIAQCTSLKHIVFSAPARRATWTCRRQRAATVHTSRATATGRSPSTRLH